MPAKLITERTSKALQYLGSLFADFYIVVDLGRGQESTRLFSRRDHLSPGNSCRGIQAAGGEGGLGITYRIRRACGWRQRLGPPFDARYSETFRGVLDQAEAWFVQR